jgi:hypothetical protein
MPKTPPAAPTIPNLSRRHRDALRELRLNSDLVIAYADKNLGLIADDAASYLAHGLDSLRATHRCLPAGPHTASNVVLETLYAMRTRLTPFLPALPPWAAKWVTVLLTGVHPRTKRAFQVPAFRLLYKIHKKTLGFRPITGNHCWATQPLALLLAFLLLPFVRCTSTYVKDSDEFQMFLEQVDVDDGHLLITYDVVNLYPSIPHRTCRENVTSFLRGMGCPFSDFAAAALELILQYNYCDFAGRVWQQIVGYATGVACGGECAHLYLEVALSPVFDPGSPPVARDQ